MAVEMKLPPILEIIRGNIVKYGNPLALKGSEIAAWAKGLNLPAQGEVLFYTGGEYQLIPFIDSLVKTMVYVDQGSKGFSLAVGMRNILDKAGINPEKIYASVLAKDKERYNNMCRKAAEVLLNLGYDLCYSGEQELYSGALLYELGFQQDLSSYAVKVAERIKQTKAKTIVCLSPHSAEVFKLVYPTLIKDFDLEVRTFVEMVWEKRDKLSAGPAERVVVHDSCRLARELNIHEELRDVIHAVGAVTTEPFRSGKWTTCCGGPGKLLFPEVSNAVAVKRISELEETGAEIVLTACPYCLAALHGGQAPVEDLIEFLYRRIER